MSSFRHMMMMIATASFILATGCGGPRGAADSSSPRLERQQSAVSALLIGVSAVDEHVVWASGSGGSVLRTIDGGATWMSITVPDADSLQFRDIHGVDASTAFVLSAGPGPASRIYKTEDGGAHWDLQFESPWPEAFFDCFDFWDPENGIAFSDAVNGEFVLIVTGDGGRNWSRIPPGRLTEAAPHEGGFAASGTCLVTHGDSTAIVGTGNGPKARLLLTHDRGRSWDDYVTPLRAGEGAGIFSLVFPTMERGLVLGGDLGTPDAFIDNVARTQDGGRTWASVGRPTFPGAVYGAVYVDAAGHVVAVGPNGMSLSDDFGTTWAPLDSLSHWGVDSAGSQAWAVGPEGRITRISFRR